MSRLPREIALDPVVIDGPEIALNLGFTGCISVPAARAATGPLAAAPTFVDALSVSLSAGELAAISAGAREARLAQGKPALREGELVRAALFVRSGSMRVFRRAPDGRQQPMGDIPAGSLALGAQLLAGTRSPATLVALMESEFLVFEKAPLVSAASRFSRLRRLLTP